MLYLKLTFTTPTLFVEVNKNKSQYFSKILRLFYCTLHGRIKGFNSSVTTILFEVGSYRVVIG